MQGDTKVIDFDDISVIPAQTTTSGATGTYNSTAHTIVVSNITADITLTATYNTGGSGTPSDPYIDDSPAYDPNTVVAGTTLYDEVDGEPKVTVVEDQSGNTTVTAFEYTDTGTDGVEFGTGQGANGTLDTGVLAFNDDMFSIHIKFKMIYRIAIEQNIFYQLYPKQEQLHILAFL